MSSSEVWGAANAANDTSAAMQSGMLQSWQSNHYVTQMQQSGHAEYAAMGHRMLTMQQLL
jgi:hypothetical protein